MLSRKKAEQKPDFDHYIKREAIPSGRVPRRPDKANQGRNARYLHVLLCTGCAADDWASDRRSDRILGKGKAFGRRGRSGARRRAPAYSERKHNGSTICLRQFSFRLDGDILHDNSHGHG